MKTFSTLNTTIEQTIASVYNALTARADDDTVVIREKALKGSSCKGLISVFRRDDFERAKHDKSHRTTAAVRYAFYPATYHPSRLGSVAIYGDDTASLRAMLHRQGTLFGLPIAEVKVEIGRRPFVDVTLVA